MPENKVVEELKVGNDVFVPFISAEKIAERVKELGEEISKDYEGKVPVFIGVLNGACIFHSDLIRNISVENEVDFFKLSSYGDDKISSGRWIK